MDSVKFLCLCFLISMAGKLGFFSFLIELIYAGIYPGDQRTINLRGCQNNVTRIGAHIAEVLLFISICSALHNTLRQPEHTFLAGQSIFGSIFHTLQWGHASDTDTQQIQGHISNCISFQINDI